MDDILKERDLNIAYSANERMLDVKEFPESNIEEFCNWHESLNMSIVQLDAGVFKSDTCLIDLHDTFLAKNGSNLRYFSTGMMPGYIRFSFPLNVQGPLFTGKSSYCKGKLITYSNEADTCSCAVMPEDFQQIIVGIKIDALSNYLSSKEIGSLLDAVNSDNEIVVESYYGEMTTYFMHHIHKKLLGIYKDTPDKKVFVDQYSRLVILYLSEYISNNRKKIEATRDISSYERILGRGLHYMMLEKGVPISLEKLSTGIYSSKRSIQYAFSELINMTQMEFSRLARLSAVRSELFSINGSGETVSDILLKYNINNSGRFRHEYFNFFGEFPKDTFNGGARHFRSH